MNANLFKNIKILKPWSLTGVTKPRAFQSISADAARFLLPYIPNVDKRPGDEAINLLKF
jgi:hypothetical protein